MGARREVEEASKNYKSSLSSLTRKGYGHQYG